MWGITGGRLEPMQTPEICAVREIKEETGLFLDPSDLRLFSIYAEPDDGRILQYPDNRVHLVDIVYTATIPSCSRFVLSSESFELAFFSASTIPDSIVPPSVKPISDLINSNYLL